MAEGRVQTTAVERTHQNHRLRDEVAVETGQADITVAKAAQHRREQRAQTRGPIPARDIDFTDDDVKPIGVLLGSVDNYKVLKGGAAQLALVTDSREFGDILHDAARISTSDIIVAALYHVPREYGLEPEPEPLPDGEWDPETPTPGTSEL